MSRPPVPVDPCELSQRMYDSFPPELLRLKRWHVWGWNVANQRKLITAKVNDPLSWWSFEKASMMLINSPSVAGLLFAVGDGLACVDLDNVLQNGVAIPQAQRIVNGISSYTEISPSGTGLHILAKINDAALPSKRRENVEVYTSKRWLCVTGDVFQNRSVLYEATTPIARLIQSLTKRKPMLKPIPLKQNEIPASDADLLRKMFDSKNGDRIKAAWECRSAHASPSEGDMALVGYLMYWTGGDTERTRGLFFQSPRGERVKAQRADYFSRMVAKIDGRGFKKNEHDRF